jgi:hypothetical protein
VQADDKIIFNIGREFVREGGRKAETGRQRKHTEEGVKGGRRRRDRKDNEE